MANSFENALNMAADDFAEAATQSFRTLGEALRADLLASGVQHANAVNITVNQGGNDGPTHFVVDDSDPILNQPIPEGATVRIEKVNSADAGSF